MATKKTQLLFFAGLLMVLAGCKGNYTDVSNDPEYRKYNSLIGKEFRTTVPQYLIRLEPENPYVNMYTEDEIGIPGIEKVKQFPYQSGSEVVYGILPVGSTYRITKAIQDNSSTMGGVDYRAVITSSGSFEGMTIRTRKVVNPEVYGPDFKYEDVEEVAPTK